MSSNSFSPFVISEGDELFALCLDLKNKKVKNSPWAPFFVQNECSENNKDLFNVYEIAETTVEEVEIDDDAASASVDAMEICVEEGNPKTAAILDQELEDQLQKLKEMLINIKNLPPQLCWPEVVVFNSISPCQVPAVCQVLQLSALSDAAIAVILNSLSTLDSAISLILAASVVHHAVHSRIENWTSDTARELTTSILMFTKKYPKAVIDELLLPFLKDESLGTSQADLLHDIIKRGLPEDQVPYCLRESLEISSPNENTFTGIHCLIDRKVHLDTSLCCSLTERILKWSEDFSSNVKFSKLLKSIISTYGSQMTEEQLFVLNIAVKNNTTFVKKNLENMLKKLSVKLVKPI